VLKWLPLLWSNLARRKTRSILTMLSVLTTFILFGLLDSFRSAVATYGDDYANALVVQSRNTRLPYSHVTRLLSMPGLIAACGVVIAPARLPSEKRTLVQGVQDPALFRVHPGIRLSPEALSAWRRERSAVLIGAEVAAANGWRAGDRLTLPGLPRGAEFRRSDGRNVLEIVVAGVFTAENTVAVQGILAHYEYLRDLVGPERAGMEYIAVRLAPGEDIDSMRSRIDAEFQSSAAPVKTYSFRALLRAYYGTYRELARLSGVVVIVSAITLLLIAGSVLVQSQRERSRETAVLEAFGWSKWRVAVFLGLEAVALIAPPAILGLAVSGLIARRIDVGVSLLERGSLPASALIDGLLLIVIFAVATAVVPIARSASAEIATRLARE
jgi:putative ABC transport system permease protein